MRETIFRSCTRCKVGQFWSWRAELDAYLIAVHECSSAPDGEVLLTREEIEDDDR